MFTEQLQGEPQVLLMFLQVSAEDKNIIEKYDDKLTNVSPEYSVHETMKSCRGVAQAKWHHSEVVVPVVSFEGCLLFILLAHTI